MPREQRAVADEPRSPLDNLRPLNQPSRWPQGVLRAGTIVYVKSPIRYKAAKNDDPYKVENRWYYAGAVNIAFVQVFKPGTQRSGDYAVHMTSQAGNSGVWFTDEDEMHKFIEEELKREPL